MNRPLTFQCSGFSRVRRPFFCFHRSPGLHYRLSGKIRVNIPPNDELSDLYSNLVEALIRDWGRRLSILECSTGDFGAALKQRKVSLGHIWVEVYSLSLDFLCKAIFNERFRVIRRGKNFIDYQAEINLSDRCQPGFSGLEDLTTDYLNACIVGEVYPIHEKLATYAKSRRLKLPISTRRKVSLFLFKI